MDRSDQIMRQRYLLSKIESPRGEIFTEVDGRPHVDEGACIPHPLIARLVPGIRLRFLVTSLGLLYRKARYEVIKEYENR